MFAALEQNWYNACHSPRHRTATFRCQLGQGFYETQNRNGPAEKRFLPLYQMVELLLRGQKQAGS
jgi:hypothetical protein